MIRRRKPSKELQQERLCKKALLYTRYLDSHGLVEVAKIFHERFAQFNPQWDVSIYKVKENQYFWTMSEDSEHEIQHYGYMDGKPGKDILKLVKAELERITGRKIPYSHYAFYNSAPELRQDNFRCNKYCGDRAKKFLKDLKRKEKIEKLKAKPAPKTTDTNQVNFVYSLEYVMHGDAIDDALAQLFERYSTEESDRNGFDCCLERQIVPRQIIKITDKTIFVDKNPYKPGPNKRYLVDCYHLNRSEFERDGFIYQKSTYKYFYRNKNTLLIKNIERKGLNFKEFFDIKGEITSKKLKAAYRKNVKELHPDHGGDVTQFIQFKEMYKIASKVWNQTERHA